MRDMPGFRLKRCPAPFDLPQTAELVHIDLGVAFEQGKLLPTPELVPFRLTRDMVDGMKQCAWCLGDTHPGHRMLRHGWLECWLHPPITSSPIDHNTTLPFSGSGMGVLGVEGVFRRCCEHTMEVLRHNHEAVLTILDVFLHDPLYKWTVSPKVSVAGVAWELLRRLNQDFPALLCRP